MFVCRESVCFPTMPRLNTKWPRKKKKRKERKNERIKKVENFFEFEVRTILETELGTSKKFCLLWFCVLDNKVKENLDCRLITCDGVLIEPKIYTGFQNLLKQADCRNSFSERKLISKVGCLNPFHFR
jgi:hypothetical protein